jgi:DolP-mannose mannosyltransferase
MGRASDIKAIDAPTIWFRLTSGNNSRMFLIAAFLMGVAVILAHRPWSQMEIGDEAIWDYIAQSIVRGQVPYRDIVEIKTPLSAHMGALAILGGKLVGLRDVMSIRALHVVMVGFLSVITLLTGETYLRNRLSAIIAFLVPLASWHFAEWMAAGTEPKLPMTLFGMLSLLLFAKDRPFWAGFCSMLSCLCWQPGLLFTGSLLLVASNYFTTWRDGRALRVVAGAVIPLAILLLYFFHVRALGDLWDWTIRYNYSIYAAETSRAFGEALIHLWHVLLRVFGAGIVVVAISLIGLMLFGIQRVRERLERKTIRPGESFRDVLLIPPLVYLGFCLINFQSGPDLIPFFPFIGLFAGWFFVETGKTFSGWLSRKNSRRLAPRLVPGLALVVTAGLILYRSMVAALEQRPQLKDQDIAFETVSSRLMPFDRIYVHGTAELLVLLDRPNMNPYIFLDRGKDDYIARRLGDGFGLVIDQMELLAPKIVALSKLAKVSHRAELEGWVSAHYDKLDVSGYDGIYIRKSQR